MVLVNLLLRCRCQDDRAIAVLEAIAEVRMEQNASNVLITQDFGSRRRIVEHKQRGDKLKTTLREFDSTGEVIEETRVVAFNSELFAFHVGSRQVRLMAARQAKDDVGVYLVSPFIAGISPRINDDGSVRAWLGLERNSNPTIEREDEIEGDKIVTIRMHAKDTVIRMQVNVDLLQIISAKSEYKGADGSTATCDRKNEYEPGKVLPKKCHVTEKNVDGSIDEVTMEFEYLSESIDDQEFELKSLDIPYGTMCVDTRIQRLHGYWNGSEFVENLSRKPVQPSQNIGLSLTALVSLLVLGLTSLVMFRLIKAK